jgi:hypothetical protein
VSDKSTTELLVATNASVYGGLTVGNTFSARDSLIDGGLKVDGKIETVEIDAGDIVCQNLTVNGTQTILNTSQVDIEDPLLKLANNNTTDSINTGIYCAFKDGITNRYTGLVRRSATGEWHLFDSEFEPTPTFFDSSISTILNVNVVNTNFIQCLGDEANTRVIISPNIITFETNEFRVNNVTQDTDVSSFLQVSKAYDISGPFLLPNPTPTIWDFDIPIINSEAVIQNITYSLVGGGNCTAVITIAGWYRISYSVTLMPTDDGSYCTVSVVRNNVTGDLFHDSSKTAVLKTKNRWLPMSNTFLTQMNVGDSFRPRLEITDNAGNPVNNERIQLTYFNMSCQRLMNNV